MKAMGAAAKVMTDIAKAKVPVKTGALRKHIATRSKALPAEHAVTSTIGVRYKKDEYPGGRLQQPAVYAVMVERGANPGRKRKGRGRKFDASAGDQHTMPARPFLRPAFDEGHRGAVDRFAEVLTKELADVL
jgi:HK97 gp10 family phage protein